MCSTARWVSLTLMGGKRSQRSAEIAKSPPPPPPPPPPPCRSCRAPSQSTNRSGATAIVAAGTAVAEPMAAAGTATAGTTTAASTSVTIETAIETAPTLLSGPAIILAALSSLVASGPPYPSEKERQESREPVFRHYSWQPGIDGILAKQQVLSSRKDNLVFLTPQLFTSGEVARRALEMNHTPVAYFAVPVSRLNGVIALQNTGHGGIQIAVSAPVNVTGLKPVYIGP